MARGIDRRRDGSYRVRLPAEERDILAALPGQLREALDAGEPTLYRLFRRRSPTTTRAMHYARPRRRHAHGRQKALGLERTAHAGPGPRRSSAPGSAAWKASGSFWGRSST
jgi:hypothetical protein